MPVQDLRYCEYFNVNEKYFPCIDESAINSGATWDTTFPHETFIDLLNKTEKMLSGSTNRSIWIHGAYGTGKSQCAFALKRILEVSEEDVRDYWSKYDALKQNPVLLEKIIGHKAQGIVVAYRYASGSITTPQQLFFAVQESIKKALESNDVPYKGENSLKEGVIAWLEDPIHNKFMNALLEKPKWVSTFSQSSADEIINSLRKSDDVSSLMDDIFSLAAEEGITALDLTADSLRTWITDIIEKNHIKLVLIWDEFSDYFRQNNTSLGEFQKIVSICQEQPFYFVIVTHPLSSLAKNYDSNDKTNPWSVVQQRFEKVEITLPDNIAFDLIGHAFSVKDAAKSNWAQMTGDLNSSVNSSRSAVIKAVNIKNEDVMRNILPLHPIAALVLKNIAAAFQSNQRSMFDFIKTPKDMDVHAFQWFIQNSSPLSDRPFLTVDMLWDFFYEKGKDYLSPDIKLILDTFPQQTQLTEKEKIVLKTILIMQSIDQRLGGALPILKPTDQNLSYAFEGDMGELESTCKSIAKALVTKGILIENPIADGKKAYSAAVLAGDSAKIDAFKKEVREKQGTTAKLVSEGPNIAMALSLPPALKLRYALDIESGKLPVVTASDFTRAMDALKNKDVNWRFYAVLALAKTDEEAQSFRTLIQKTVSDPAYKNTVVIDALSSPLGLEAFEQYVDFSAMSMYYNGNNNQQSKLDAKKAKDVLERDWKDRIHDGQFIVYTYANQEGEKVTGATKVHEVLQTIVLNRFRYVLDFTKGLSESQLKLTPQAKSVARLGMGDLQIQGLIKGCEDLVLRRVWGKKAYWEDEALATEPLVVVKKAVDKMISASFNDSGKISIGDIYDFLESTYGFSVCNLSAFIVGFLLKEYNTDPYRSMDSEGHRDSMTPDKLAEMIGNYIGKNPKPTYIVSLTDEERAFYDLTEAAWGIKENSCSSPSQAGSAVLSKMRELGYPVWCLEDVDTVNVYDLVKLYIKLVQSPGDKAHDIANEIGKIALQRPSSEKSLNALLTPENCKKGMQLFLERFDGRKLLNVAKEIGAENSVLPDIKKAFSVQYSALWIGTTGEDEIKKLTVEYEIVKYTNTLLNVSAHSKDEAFKAWKETLKFIGFSCEAAKAKKPSLGKLLDSLLRIANNGDMLPDNMSSLYEEMADHITEIRDVLGNPLAMFTEIYAPYLAGFNEVECEEIKNSITAELFTASATASNAIVKKAAEDYKKKQVITQLYKLWNEKTGTKTPRSWSEKFRTPILCCIEEALYADAKKAFSTLNSSTQSESEVLGALDFLQNATFFDMLADEAFRNRCFVKAVIGEYSSLLPDIDTVRDALEHMGISAYDWNDNPAVKSKISEMATAEYNSGGSDRAVDVIRNMSDAELKKWLTDAVRDDMGLGVRIIINGKE